MKEIVCPDKVYSVRAIPFKNKNIHDIHFNEENVMQNSAESVPVNALRGNILHVYSFLLSCYDRNVPITGQYQTYNFDFTIYHDLNYYAGIKY